MPSGGLESKRAPQRLPETDLPLSRTSRRTSPLTTTTLPLIYLSMSEKFEEKEERDLESMAVRPAPLDGGVEGGSTYATDGVQRGLSSRHMR